MSNLTIKQMILIFIGVIIFGIVGTFLMLWALNTLHDVGVLIIYLTPRLLSYNI